MLVYLVLVLVALVIASAYSATVRKGIDLTVRYIAAFVYFVVVCLPLSLLWGALSFAASFMRWAGEHLGRFIHGPADRQLRAVITKPLSRLFG